MSWLVVNDEHNQGGALILMRFLNALHNPFVLNKIVYNDF